MVRSALGRPNALDRRPKRLARAIPALSVAAASLLPLVPIARIVKLDDDGAIAIPLADPANTSFAIVEPPFEPDALAEEARAAESP